MSWDHVAAADARMLDELSDLVQRELAALGRTAESGDWQTVRWRAQGTHFKTIAFLCDLESRDVAPELVASVRDLERLVGSVVQARTSLRSGDRAGAWVALNVLESSSRAFLEGAPGPAAA